MPSAAEGWTADWRCTSVFSGRRLIAALLFLGAVAAVTVIGSTQLLGTQHHPIISRAAAIEAACPRCPVRVDAKLIRLSDLNRAHGSDTGWSNDLRSYFWAVAIAGGQGVPYWRIALIKDQPGPPHEWGGEQGGGEFIPNPAVTWPPFWNRLPDYSE